MIKKTYGSPMPKITRHNVLNTLICIGMALSPTISAAETLGVFSIVETKSIKELWLNPGFYSYHFQRNKGLNGNNSGVGVEYRYSTVNSITVGEFYNSDRRTSHYVGWVWQPLALGPIRLGAVAGVIDGYQRMNNGSWFPAAIPTASFEYKSVGANLVLIPSYKDKLDGSISLQLKLKVY